MTSTLDPDDARRRDDAPVKRKPKVFRYVILLALVLAGVATVGIFDRRKTDSIVATWTDARAIPTVELVTPHKATENEHLNLPASIEAFYTAPVHSRVDGYVKMWYFDIGARVKAGQVLATIDTPDLDQQYEQVKGELLRSQANYNLAVVTADRWKALRASGAVSEQTVDEKVGDAAAQNAQVTTAEANVARIKALEDFKNIVAPFDGVVTARRIDVGALVSARNTSPNALFDVASVNQMRVYVRVPQVYAANMHEGLKVKLTLPQYPRQTFQGTIETTSGAISDASRALLVEAIFPNAQGLLSPGAYAEASFDLPLDPSKIVIPPSSMIFRDLDPEVAVVKDNRIVLRKVTVLVDTGNEIEISNGLDLGERIVLHPSYSMESGEEVNVAKIDGRSIDGGAHLEIAHEAER